ncbi:MAG: 4'-phosphopantetheinyl transferase family protein [Aquabacterium sp.]
MATGAVSINGPPSIGLWRLDLSEAPDAAECALLQPDEIERAKRLVFDRDRRRYLSAHVGLRQVLARHCGIDPGLLRIQPDALGKPVLTGKGLPSFNLTHTGDLALVAIGQAGVEVGVDAEMLRNVPDAEQLVDELFAGPEATVWRGLPPHLRSTAFLVGWTRKEAALKAVGCGLNLPPREVHVGLDPVLVDVEVVHGLRRATVSVTSQWLDTPAGPAAVALAEWATWRVPAAPSPRRLRHPP